MINEYTHNVTDVVFIVIPLFELLRTWDAHLSCYRDIIPDYCYEFDEWIAYFLTKWLAS